MFQFLHVAGYKVFSFLVLPFLLSLGNPAPAHKSTVPLKAPAVQSSCSLTFSGPDPSGTYCINNWNGRCTTWYLNGSYVTTYNGCLTIYFNNGSPNVVSAVQHTDCNPYGSVIACGSIVF